MIGAIAVKRESTSRNTSYLKTVIFHRDDFINGIQVRYKSGKL